MSMLFTSSCNLHLMLDTKYILVIYPLSQKRLTLGDINYIPDERFVHTCRYALKAKQIIFHLLFTSFQSVIYNEEYVSSRMVVPKQFGPISVHEAFTVHRLQQPSSSLVMHVSFFQSYNT